MTPEDYRILFGEDPPSVDAPPSPTQAPPSATQAPPSDEPEVLIDLTSEEHTAPSRFTVQPVVTRVEPEDTRPLWRKKRAQFPAAILLMIALLSIDNASDDGGGQTPADPAVTSSDGS